jgi:integrase
VGRQAGVVHHHQRRSRRRRRNPGRHHARRQDASPEGEAIRRRCSIHGPDGVEAVRLAGREKKDRIHPCAGVRAPRAARPKSRVLSDDEIRKFWNAAGEEQPEFASPLKLLLLTGCRRDEVANLRRAELSPDCSAINLPGSRTKNHRDHVVPLSALARELIGGAGDGDFVFSTTGRRPVQLGTKVKHRMDAKMAIAPWTLHDLRRTAATGMAKLRVAPHVIEAVLNRVSGHKAGVAGIYNVYQYDDEKRVALERWAGHVAGLVEVRPANVVTMRSAAS